MDSLGRHHTGGYRIVFTIFLPSSDRYTLKCYRRQASGGGFPQARHPYGGLAPTACTHVRPRRPSNEDLLRPEDLTRLFPHRPSAFDRYLVSQLHRTLPAAVHQRRSSPLMSAGPRRLLNTLGDLSAINQEAIEAWQNDRLTTVVRKTVNLEQDVLRQLLDLCVRHRWCPNNPARLVKKLSWKLSRLPRP